MMRLPYPETIGDLRVRRAWPDGERLTLELADADARISCGYWDPATGVALVPNDTQLPGLASLLRAGAELVSHRLGKRAVVHVGDTYVKVVRPGRAAELAQRHHAVAAALSHSQEAPRVPALRSVDDARGMLTFDTLAGTALHERFWAPTDLGRALAAFARSPVTANLPTHGPESERSVLRMWVGNAARFGVLDSRGEAYARLVTRADAALARQAAAPQRLLHRDLHDGQLLHLPDNGFGILDLDTAATGDPALDIGNLIAHLALSARVGAGDTSGLVDIVKATADGPHWAERVAAYALGALARLLAVHAFRPRGDEVAAAILGELVAPQPVADATDGLDALLAELAA